MLTKVADCMQFAKDVVHPLHPLQSISQIAVGALALLSVPFTGTVGLINGIAGLSNGSINMAHDLAEAGSTLSKWAQSKPITKKDMMHLTMSMGVFSVALFTVLNPLVAVVAAKTSAFVMSKSLLAGLCLI